MSNPEEERLSDNWAPLYQAQLSRYETIFSADNNVDTKAGVIFGVSIAMLAVMPYTKIIAGKGGTCAMVLFVISLVCLALSILASCIIILPVHHPLPANTTEEKPEYITLKHDVLMYQLIADTESAANDNFKMTKGKARLLTGATIAFLLCVVTLVVVKVLIGE